MAARSDAEDSGRRTFSTSFRGFDQGEVKAYLEVVAKEFDALRARISELEQQLETAKQPAERVPLDVASLTAALGEEAANLLRVAKQTGDDVRARADEAAARILREAQEEAARIRSSAESVLADRTTEAEAQGAQILAAVEEETMRLRRQAEAEAQSRIAKAVSTGKEMVGEAQAARERMLGDLTRRRNSALRQIEILHGGRERLTAALVSVRSDVDHLLDELAEADAEARRATEAIGRPKTQENAAAAPPGETPAPAEAQPGVDEASADEPGVVASTEDAPSEPAPDAEPEAEAGDLEPVTEPEAAQPAPDSGTVASAPAPPEGESVSASPDATPSQPEPAGEPGSAEPVAVESTPAEGPGASVASEPDPQAPPRSSPEPAAAEPEPAAARSSEPVGHAHDPVPAAVFSGSVVGEVSPPGRVDQLFAQIRANRAVPEQTAATAPAGSPVAVAIDDRPTEAMPVVANESDLEAPRGDTDEAYLEQRDALLEQANAGTGRRLKRMLADDQNALLENLRTHASDTVALEDVFGEGAAQVRAWARVAAPGLIDAAAAGARLGGGNPPADLTALAEIAERLATSLIEPLRERLAAVLEAAGGDRSEATTDRINGVFREVRSRVERAAGDSVTEALGAGFVAAVEPGTAVRWVVSDVDGPCADCDDNALAGAVGLGEAFPTGQAFPPAHSGCRCVLMRTAPVPAS